MSAKRKQETLSDKISSILDVAPKIFDPEDDANEETSAKVLLQPNEFEENEDDDLTLSRFRKQNVQLLEDFDQRYIGRKSSRKQLLDSEDEESDGMNDGGDVDDDKESEKDEEESVVESESSVGEEGETFDDEGESLDGTRDDNFQHIRGSDKSLESKKGHSVRNQLTIWENLVEMRIQLQKCLIAANKMPEPKMYRELKEQCKDNFLNEASKTKNSVRNLLDQLLTLQLLLSKQYSETRNVYSKGQKKTEAKDNDEEEIPSDTEDELEDDKEADDTIEPDVKRRKTSDFENVISERENQYKSYRNSVIEKWNEKTRVGVSKTNTPVYSVLNQINHILSNKEKLIKRTQLNRSGTSETMNKSATDTTNDQSEDYNAEIFDDSDFYHQILRELIEYKSADVTDPIQLSRQWVQLQSLRSKMKRNIDTKATKGRKIRYVVHPKLVNFMAPIDNEVWLDEAKNELYNSLFGKNQPVNRI